MKKLSMHLITIFIFGLSIMGYASAEDVLFEGIFERGNAIFQRAIGGKGTSNKGNGVPVAQFVNFSGSSGEATLKVCNVEDAEKISSAKISINGNVVLGSSNFNQNVGCIEKKVNLNDGDNIMEVQLKSNLGGKVSIEILQLKPDIPPPSDVCDGDGTILNTWMETILVGMGNPLGISVSPDGNYVYVTHPLSNMVSVIPTSDSNVDIETIDLGVSKANGISVSPDGNYVYVTHLDNKLSVILLSDDNTVKDNTVKDIKTGIAVGNKPWGVAVSPNGGEYVYVSNYGDNTISAYSTTAILESDNPNPIGTITAGNNHRGVAVSPNGEYVYVSNFDDSTISAISTTAILESDNNTEIETIWVGEYPMGVSVSPDGKYIYVSNSGENTVSVISICDNTEEKINVVRGNPAGVAVSPNGENVYVSSYVSVGTISVFGFKSDDQIIDSF